MELSRAASIVNEYATENGGKDGVLIEILHDIQAEENYLPKELLYYMSQNLGIPLSEVYRVASFYRAFSLVPKGHHLVQVCSGTSCHVRGGSRVMDKAEHVLGIKAGETTKDREFSLERVNCLGCCALGPVMVVDGECHGNLAVSKVKKILANCCD